MGTFLEYWASKIALFHSNMYPIAPMYMKGLGVCKESGIAKERRKPGEKTKGKEESLVRFRSKERVSS